ncbi:LamG domain-containing protein [Flavobacterium silvaticum]|uniref:LamG domain-containing protein n=1 Tax=Flavobacterium silvaticum TaxID=1852020 RepID=A0A972FR48_9FLAO|nr:LamG domain-containing protein [Flavobacterium silvaticum]NMH26963.1 LamG domain-containing protein [Flavobacterium silvaticum]
MKTRKILISALLSGVVLTSLVSCGDDDNGTSLPPIGGYNSADEVGAADLKAYFPLNGNSTESKSGTAANDQSNVTWVEGPKGQAAHFNDGYLAYPVISALSSMTGSVSISLWAKVGNNGTHATMFFSLTKPTGTGPDEWNGAANVMAETGIGNRLVSSDTLKVKGLFNIDKADGSSFGGDAVNAEQLTDEDIANGGAVVVNQTANEWMHVVYTYDGATATNKLYVNGVKISNPQWERRNVVDGVDVAVPFNAKSNARAIIGTFGSLLSGGSDTWQDNMTGDVDEIRVWNKTLSQQEIGFLYELELAGR